MAHRAIKINRLISMIVIWVDQVLHKKVSRSGCWYPKIQFRLTECESAKENCVQIKSGQPCPDSIKYRLGWFRVKNKE